MSLKGYDEPWRKRLADELPGAILAAEAEGYMEAGGEFGSSIDLPRVVEDRIIKDNRLLRDTRKKKEPSWEGGSRDMIVALPDRDRGLHGDHVDHADASPEDQLLETFARWERDKRRDKLSEELPAAEWEIAEFLRHHYAEPEGGLTPLQAAALALGKAPSTVRVQVRKMRDRELGT